MSPVARRGLRAVLVWTVLALVACEMVVRSDWLYAALPDSPTGRAIVKEQRMRAAPGPLRVLILGDSRAINGINPTVLMQSMGLSPRHSYNLAVQKGSPFTMRRYWHRNPDKFADVELVIYTTGAWWLDRKQYAESHNSKDMVWMTSARMFDVFPFPDSMANAVFGTYRNRTWLRFHARLAWHEALGNPIANENVEDAFGFANLRAEVRWGDWMEGAHRWYRGGAGPLTGTTRHDFEALMVELRQAGVGVAVVEMPYPADAMQVRDSMYSPQYGRVVDYFQSNGKRLGYVYLDYGNGPIEDEALFFDSLHMNALGAQRFSQLLARDLILVGLAPPPRPAASPSVDGAPPPS